MWHVKLQPDVHCGTLIKSTLSAPGINGPRDPPVASINVATDRLFSTAVCHFVQLHIVWH
jgi:hypothetical protein